MLVRFVKEGGPKPRRAASAMGGLILMALGTACDRGGETYACSCTFLTDFDDTSRQATRVCAPNADRAQSLARGCAGLAAPGPIQECVCRKGGDTPCNSTGCLK